jgi:hypothetical protein
MAVAKEYAKKILPWLGWASVGFLLVAALPLFICMPLWSDATIIDLCCRNISSGRKGDIHEWH